MKKNLAFGALAAALTLGAGSAQAYATNFGEDLHSNATTQKTPLTNSTAAQQTFLSSLINERVEGFEDATVGATSLTLTFPSASSSSGLTASLFGVDNGEVASNAPGGAFDGRYSVPGGTRYWLANAVGGLFTLTFNTPIAAFGFYGVDIGDFGGSLSLQLRSGTTLVSTLPVPNTVGVTGSTDGSVLFYGLIASNPSELFDSVTFSLTGTSSDLFAFDSFTIAEAAQVIVVDPDPDPVPEPGSLALAAAALAALGLVSRRKA